MLLSIKCYRNNTTQIHVKSKLSVDASIDLKFFSQVNRINVVNKY